MQFYPRLPGQASWRRCYLNQRLEEDEKLRHVDLWVTVFQAEGGTASPKATGRSLFDTFKKQEEGHFGWSRVSKGQSNRR